MLPVGYAEIFPKTNRSNVVGMAPICVVVPPGLQALLGAVGLIRTLATTDRVLACVELDHLPHVHRLFHGARVTFWFDEPDPETRAVALGYRVVRLPELPKDMYEAVDLPPKHMHSSWSLQRDKAREHELLERVTGAYGQSYILTWGDRLREALFPCGIPAVDARSLPVDSPFDYCTLMQRAMQVHAPDSWFLTLADLVGGESRKFCHAYASSSPAATCRKKYRRRVSILCAARPDNPSDFFSKS